MISLSLIRVRNVELIICFAIRKMIKFNDMLNSRVPWEFQWKYLSILRGAVRNEEIYLGVITIDDGLLCRNI